MLTCNIVKRLVCDLRLGILCADAGEAVGKALVVLVGGVLEETKWKMFVSKT
jgi:hypothetical protein